MVAQMDFPNEDLDDDARAELARREQVAALRREHAGYVLYGRGERAEQVEAALKALGEPLEDASESAPRERAVPRRKSTTS